jgi:VWFA-related protein
MTWHRLTRRTRILVGWLQVALLWPAPSSGQVDYTFHAQTEIVLVNVTVRDKSGRFVQDLRPQDFKLFEDGKPQQILSFDTETIGVQAAPPLLVGALPSALATPASPSKMTDTSAAKRPFKDHRLIILFFDVSAMEPDEIDRAATVAENYVDKRMTDADLVAVVSLDSSLEINQDFTSDRLALHKVLGTFNAGAGQGFEEGSTGTTEGTPDTAGSFTPDDTEYNIFNTDRRLNALRSVAEKLSHVDEKKSLIYFSSGMDRTGIENQSELRAATNAAVRANLSIYTVDVRGLQALVPGGEAQNASLRGTSPYSGQSTLNALNSNFTTQETLITLAGDTGGRAFTDSNDLSKVFKSVQDDTAMYYVLGFRSTNSRLDGRYRRITVRMNRPGLKIEYRRGYYALADYQHSTKDDREEQLQRELSAELPATDLPLYLSAGYFRLGSDKFFATISLVVPGSEIPFVSSSNVDKATLDVIGVALAPGKRPLGEVRDTMKLSINSASQVRRKNVQYDSGFILPAGTYHLRFVVRENQTGRMGSFETDFNIPDLRTQPLRMSSIILASQIQPALKRHNPDDPLVHDGSEIIPSVTHVFSSTQHLYLYYEVYDPGHQAPSSGGAGPSSEASSIRLLTNVAFFQGKRKAYESPLVEAKELSLRNRKAAVFQLDVPLTQLKPGFYTCQVNVIDDVSGRFVFPRMVILVRQ